jgi:hypothetical protein
MTVPISGNRRIPAPAARNRVTRPGKARLARTGNRSPPAAPGTCDVAVQGRATSSASCWLASAPIRRAVTTIEPRALFTAPVNAQTPWSAASSAGAAAARLAQG